MENTNSWKSQIQKNTNFEKRYNFYADKNDLRKIEMIKDYENQALGNCPAPECLVLIVFDHFEPRRAIPPPVKADRGHVVNRID